MLLCLLPPLVTIASGSCLIPLNSSWHLTRWTLVTSIIAVVAILIFMNLIPTCAEMIMRKFQLGGYKDVAITVDYAGCRLLSLNGYSMDCKKNEEHIAESIDVKWRPIESYIEFTTKGEDKKKIGLILPAKHITGFAKKIPESVTK